MKIVALEEHFVTAEVLDAWGRLDGDERDMAVGQTTPPDIQRRLLDCGDERVRMMDESGVDVQVLSITTPGVQNLAPDDAVALAARTNNRAAEVVRSRPDRFQAFATLPTPAPEQAARELERAVRELGLDGAMLNGRTRERPLDHPDLLPIFEAAASLRAPLYIHPQMPVRPVREAYYSGLGDKVDQMFAQGGIGWHYETGVQLLRLVLAGVFDRFPDLQVIVGHWGEAVLFYLDRIDMLNEVADHLQRPIHDYFRRNVSVTPSGIFSPRYLRWSREVLGVERILFSVDYPFIPAPNGAARAFLESAVPDEAERRAIAYGNWDRLRADIRR